MDARSTWRRPLVSAEIFLEGGGDRNSDRARCREGFRKLFERCGFRGKMPKFVACGGRTEAYDDFKTAHSQASPGDFIALLVDSEDPVANVEETWQHVALRLGDKWAKPSGADDEQLLFMTTSMETWIVIDRTTLKTHFGPKLRDSALPSLQNIEHRDRHVVLRDLENASRDCPGPYSKGQKSFEVLGKLNPEVLEQHLPSFKRVRRILDNNL